MAKLNATQYQEKWARRLKGASQDIKLGVERTTENPADKAILALDKMAAGFMEALNSGKIERGLRTVTLQSWKDSMLKKGLQNLAAGVDGAESKVKAKAAILLAAVDRVQASVEQMPSTTFEDRLNRMNAWARGMHDADMG